MTSSGTTSYNPSLTDLVLEAYSRIQIRPTSLVQMHMRDAVQSAQLLLAEWATKPSVPNLWKVALLSTPLIQGQAQYSVPQNVIGILDYYIRTYQVGSPQNLTPTVATVQGSNTTTVTIPNHGLSPGEWMSFVVPVSQGGNIFLGFYQLQNVPTADTFTILSAANATSTGTSGVVPSFTTTTGSTVVTVNLPNHGLFAGQNFSVQVTTLVGGLTLSGVYTVATSTPDSFTITSNFPAASDDTEFENTGLAQYETQLPNTDPIDYVITPFSRTDYADQPNKETQARPTTVWFNRQINGVLNLWPTPDQNGPYVLYYYAWTQIQDATLPFGATMDLPYRFFEAFAAGLAARLARKYPPPLTSGVTVNDLKMEADAAWLAASNQDSEDVTLYIIPMVSAYYNN